MSRWELYQRTVGYPVNGMFLLIFLSCLIIPFFFVSFIIVPIKIPIILTSILCFYFVYLLLFFLIYYKYWLDILYKSVEEFHGLVVIGEKIPGTILQSSNNSQRWEVVEKDNFQNQEKFVIFPGILQKIYGTHAVFRSMDNGPVSFYYLKRSKCILEITNITIREEKSMKKHRKKERKEKKKYQRFYK